MIPQSLRFLLVSLDKGVKATRDDLIGDTCIAVERVGDEEILLVFASGAVAKMHHHQDCCESVSIEDINGDLEDLLFTPLNVFDERTQDDPNAFESATWTFYTLRTIKGSIDIRWYGQSNGYYSEAASIDVYKPPMTLTGHERTELMYLAQGKS